MPPASMIARKLEQQKELGAGRVLMPQHSAPRTASTSTVMSSSMRSSTMPTHNAQHQGHRPASSTRRCSSSTLCGASRRMRVQPDSHPGGRTPPTRAGPAGTGLLAEETSELGEPLGTDIDLAPPTVTYYFETEFNHAGGAVDQLAIEHYIDDGAVFYLNGTEIERFNMPPARSHPHRGRIREWAMRASVDSLAIPNPASPAATACRSKSTNRALAAATWCSARARTADAGPLGQSAGHALPERDEEWIELYNRGGAAVDLTGWSNRRRHRLQFPGRHHRFRPAAYLVVARDAAALAAKHPPPRIIGDYSGPARQRRRLRRAGRRRPATRPTRCATTTPANGTRPPTVAARASSCATRMPTTASPAAWAPSDESSRSAWQTYSYEGVAVDDGHRQQRLPRIPPRPARCRRTAPRRRQRASKTRTAPDEFIQNGDFEGDAVGAAADKWRAHRHPWQPRADGRRDRSRRSRQPVPACRRERPDRGQAQQARDHLRQQRAGRRRQHLPHQLPRQVAERLEPGQHAPLLQLPAAHHRHRRARRSGARPGTANSDARRQCRPDPLRPRASPGRPRMPGRRSPSASTPPIPTASAT